MTVFSLIHDSMLLCLMLDLSVVTMVGSIFHQVVIFCFYNIL